MPKENENFLVKDVSNKRKKEIFPEGYPEWDRTKQVEHIVTHILEGKKAFDSEKSIPGRDIFNEANSIFVNHNIPENTFYVMLSTLVRSNTSKINCLGRKQGYFLSNDLSSIQTDNEDETEEKGKRERVKERLLYPIFSEWLFTHGFERVRDTSNSKNQDLGQWGNPDITGIKIYETLGKTTDIEFATIEVKLSLDNWKYWVFESVAHKRFSNRSYFAFSCPDDMLQKLDPDLRQYAEIYGIGILVLPLAKEFYNELIKKNSIPEQSKFDDYKSTSVIEIASSQYSPTYYHFRGRFLKAIGITTESELHKWGTTD